MAPVNGHASLSTNVYLQSLNSFSEELHKYKNKHLKIETKKDSESLCANQKQLRF